VSEDSNRVVWEFDNAENLNQVSLDVASPSPSGNTTMITAVVGLIVIGTAAFFFLRKK
jgi:LPXTG-motif cell wall-anchored protein